MKSGFWNIAPAIRNVVVQDISLVIGTDNVPQLIYFDKDNQEIRYTRKNDSGWSTPVTVASGNAEGIYFPAVKDAKNQLHLVYLSDAGGLWYVKYENNKWTAPEPIDQNEGAGYYPSIVVDGNFHPHVSYYNRSTGDLMYAFRESNGWELVCVDSTNDTGQYTSIGIDKNDNLHISYYDIDQQVLKYALCHTEPWLPNAWYTYVVDNRGNVGIWNSLLLNKDGNPQISYYNATNETLMYAYADIQDILNQ
jgi:hypothetical protein